MNQMAMMAFFSCLVVPHWYNGSIKGHYTLKRYGVNVIIIIFLERVVERDVGRQGGREGVCAPP